MDSKDCSQTSTINHNDEEVQRKLDKIYRKLDLRIIPALWCFYFLSSFGGGAYGVSLTMNQSQGHSLIEYLNLSSYDLSTASSLNFVGYILFDIPMNLMMTKVAPQAWLSRISITQGLIYASYAAVKNGGGLIAIRLIGGMCTAGAWPGMAYYITMYYPPHRIARRIGYYFTAAQVSVAIVGLVSAGFQKMDMARGYTGYQWMFIVYGCITIAVGIAINWWLPGRPPLQQGVKSDMNDSSFGGKILRLISIGPNQSFVLTPEEQELHAEDMASRFQRPVGWGLKDIWNLFKDIRIWPLILMYFGVVGCGFGVEVFATLIINEINPSLSSIDLSLLVAPIWICDLIAILIVTPLSDKYRHHRGLVFSLATLIIIVGMFVVTFAPYQWPRYVGLLFVGFGLGPTVPICMTWAAEIFTPIHGDLGAAASAALVSGLGNLGSVTTTYALYSGWPGDEQRGYRNSNMVMVAILVMSILAAGACTLVRKMLGDFKKTSHVDV